MGRARHPDKVKLIVGLLSNEIENFTKIKRLLGKKYGRVDFESEVVDFTHTSYYEEELGGSLKRKFLSFKKPLPLKNISRVKLLTNVLEKKFSKSGKRTINIDPGYLDLSKLVLFSTKDYSHRIHMQDGIYGEVTLFYKDKSFNPWPWTYPDYKTKFYIDTFNKIRDIYKDNI